MGVLFFNDLDLGLILQEALSSTSVLLHMCTVAIAAQAWLDYSFSLLTIIACEFTGSIDQGSQKQKDNIAYLWYCYQGKDLLCQ